MAGRQGSAGNSSSASERGSKAHVSGGRDGAPCAADVCVRQGRAGTTAARQRRNLLVAAGVLAVALVAYLVLPGVLAADVDDEATAESLLGISADEVTSLVWTNDEGSCSLSLEGGTWVIPNEPEAELKTSTIDDMLDALADASYERSISADEVDSAMGLDAPSITASIGLSSGETVTLAIGAETADGSDNYVRVGDGGGAYVCDSSLVSALSKTAADLYARESGPSASEISQLAIESAAGIVALTDYDGGNSELSYTTSYEWFVSDGSSTQAVSTSDATELVDSVNYVSWASVVDPSYDGSADYGFSSPTLVATLDYTKTSTEQTTNGNGETEYETVDTPGTFVLVVGSQAADGDYYAQPQGSSRVYTLAASDVETLLAASPASLVPDDVVLMDWDTVDELELTVDGATTTVDFVRDSDEAPSDAATEDGDASAAGSESSSAATSATSSASSSSSSDAVADGYTINGSELSASKAEAVMDAIDALSAESTVDTSSAVAAEASEPTVTITFRRSSERWSEMTLTLTRYDSNYYLASFNGRNDQLIGRAKVRTLLDAISALTE